jgi:hypothetical protein
MDEEPENKRTAFLKPLIFYRRVLHVVRPIKKGIRRNYGGTLSLGIKRGTLVKHSKHGFCLVGGNSNNRVTLQCVFTNKRVSRHVKKEDLKILTNLKWNCLRWLLN